MKDEVEKLREILITLGDDWLHNLRADYPDKRPNPSDRAIHKILTLFQKAQVEAVRAAAQEIHDSGMGGAKDDSERFWAMVKTATDIVDESEDRLANLKDGDTR